MASLSPITVFLHSSSLVILRQTFFQGGRQVDGAIGSLFALEQIGKSPKIRHAQESKKFTVLFDSGIRTGSDIIKALSLGAQGILCESFLYFFGVCKLADHSLQCKCICNSVGRPWVYGLAISGQAGVEQVFRQTLADLEITMGLSGYRDLSEIIGKGEAIALKQV
jgi:lactate 2-monooxygenase